MLGVRGSCVHESLCCAGQLGSSLQLGRPLVLLPFSLLSCIRSPGVLSLSSIREKYLSWLLAGANGTEPSVPTVAGVSLPPPQEHPGSGQLHPHWACSGQQDLRSQSIRPKGRPGTSSVASFHIGVSNHQPAAL